MDRVQTMRVVLLASLCCLCGGSARVAMIVPLHQPKFGHATTLVASYVNFTMSQSCDLYFVLTGAEKRDFERLMGTTPPEGVHLLEYAGSDLLHTGPTFHKKWWAVQHMIDTYECHRPPLS